GLREISALRFADLAQGEEDHGQCEAKKIIGSSGAAAMYRISSLERAEEGDKYFDENFFMYKEDCDLAYRLCLAGFKSKCVSDAIIYHDRTAAAKGNSNFKIILNRRSKNKQIKKWSFSGQQYMFLKYWKLQNFKQKLEIFWYAFRMFIFVLLFEQYLLGQYISLWQKRKKIKFRPALAGVSKS
ncbi:MAG: hypothetical protein U9R06_03355, partial [Patescibacteria group bacterium]|nr:hypothetical protein [Patescibacteria group bacterium]